MIQTLGPTESHDDVCAAEIPEPRLLVFNCHEPWIYQLRVLGMPMDIVDGLPGRYHLSWDRCMRPVPPQARLVSLSEALSRRVAYHCIIAHNIPDLLDVKLRTDPKILILHLSMPARLVEERARVNPKRYKELLHRYVSLTHTHVVAVTHFKGASWDFPLPVVQAGVDGCDYQPHSGHLAYGLRVCNFITRRSRFTQWYFHQAAFADLPIRIVGHNPDIPGAAPSRGWDHLREILRDHRFYIHTADPQLEDGFNMAMLEAMAAGLPVLGNCHPRSPIQHGVSGFLSDDPMVLREYARQLLEDPEQAYTMGQAARAQVLACFPMYEFRSGMLTAITEARLLQARAAAVTDVYEPYRAQTSAEDPAYAGAVPAATP